VIRVNPNCSVSQPPFIPDIETLTLHGTCRPHGPQAGPLLWIMAWTMCPCGPSQIGSGPGFLQGNRPTTVTVFFLFSILLVCRLNLV
jgi:hypothetical protein